MVINTNNLKRLKDYPNYIISVNGDIYSLKTKTKRKHKIDKQGYHLCNLWKNGTQYNELVHRLVMKTFNPIEMGLNGIEEFIKENKHGRYYDISESAKQRL